MIDFDGTVLQEIIPLGSVRVFHPLPEFEYMFEFFYKGVLVHCIAKKYDENINQYTTLIDELKPLFGLEKNGMKVVHIQGTIKDRNLHPSPRPTKLLLRSPKFLDSCAPITMRYFEYPISQLTDEELEPYKKDIAKALVFKMICGVKNRTQTKLHLRVPACLEPFSKDPEKPRLISSTEGEIDFSVFSLDSVKKKTLFSKVSSEKYLSNYSVGELLKEMIPKGVDIRFIIELKKIMAKLGGEYSLVKNMLSENITLFLPS